MARAFGYLPSVRRGLCRDRRSEVLHLVALSGFAVVQPLFDLLGRNATFFVAHQTSAAGILIFVATVAVGVPLGLIIIEELAAIVRPSWHRVVHLGVVCSLAGVIVAPPLSRALGDRTIVWVLAFGVMAGVFAIVYVRRGRFFKALTWMAVLQILFVGYFLFGSSARQILLPSRITLSGAQTTKDAPVVFVTFDGLSTGTLLTPGGEVDERRFPNFARLVRSTTWYRNASTTGESTHKALPSMLTGRWPERGKIPTASDYPQNLFVMLGRSHRLHLSEWQTQLCPETLCENEDEGDLALLISDAAIVYGHMVLPSRIAEDRLPSIGAQWAGFAQRGGAPSTTPEQRKSFAKRYPGTQADLKYTDHRLRPFDPWLRSIRGPAGRDLWFAHIGIPHRPWQFLDSGQIYQPGRALIPGLHVPRDTWDLDETFVAQGLQRYLLQLKVADQMLGRLLERLQATEVWDKALVIVTADHGKSFIPGAPIRVVTERNKGQILPVPLFIKYPGQNEGSIDSRLAELVDIVPTIVDVLGFNAPWKLEGASLRSTEEPRTQRRIQTVRSGLLQFDAHIAHIDEVSRQIARLFPATTDDIYNFGPHTIVGQHLADMTVTSPDRASITLDEPTAYQNVDPGSDYVPAQLAGTITGLSSSPIPIAVTLNEKVAGVGWTYARKTGQTRILILLSPRLLTSGRNDVGVFEIISNGELEAIEIR